MRVHMSHPQRPGTGSILVNEDVVERYETRGWAQVSTKVVHRRFDDMTRCGLLITGSRGLIVTSDIDKGVTCTDCRERQKLSHIKPAEMSAADPVMLSFAFPAELQMMIRVHPKTDRIEVLETVYVPHQSRIVEQSDINADDPREREVEYATDLAADWLTDNAWPDAKISADGLDISQFAYLPSRVRGLCAADVQHQMDEIQESRRKADAEWTLLCHRRAELRAAGEMT